MAGRGRKIMIGCGIGCAAALVLTIIVTVGGGLLLMRPFNRAIEDQEVLADRYGDRDAYAPGPQTMTPERLDRFLAVRAPLQDLCIGFEEIGEAFTAMEEIDKSGEAPSSGLILKSVGDVMGAAFGIAGKLGEYTEARNAALVEQDMGLGEYVWIYTLAYYSYLGREPGTGFDGSESAGMSGAEIDLLTSMARRYGENLAAAGRSEEAALWEAESRRMARTEEGVPFAGGDLPATLADLFEPRRAELEAVFCPHTADVEFGEVERKGLSIRSR
ncbi:hypothetical protein KJ682_17925 [bacterium]|nr:hypothetical protein [bacterium]